MFITTKTTKETSWDSIKVSARNYFLKSGDEISVTLKSGEKITLVIGHDETKKAYFCFKDCIEDLRYINRNDTNAGGWAATDIRKWLNSVLLALLPDDLQDIIVPTKIVQIIDGERVVTEDKLFLFSKTQMFGKCDETENEPEDTQIDIFKKEKDRVKEHADDGSYPYSLRSSRGSSSGNFCSVNSNGSAGYSSASNCYGVAPGFCITES